MEVSHHKCNQDPDWIEGNGKAQPGYSITKQIIEEHREESCQSTTEATACHCCTNEGYRSHVAQRSIDKCVVWGGDFFRYAHTSPEISTSPVFGEKFSHTAKTLNQC